MLKGGGILSKLKGADILLAALAALIVAARAIIKFIGCLDKMKESA